MISRKQIFGIEMSFVFLTLCFSFQQCSQAKFQEYSGRVVASTGTNTTAGAGGENNPNNPNNTNTITTAGGGTSGVTSGQAGTGTSGPGSAGPGTPGVTTPGAGSGGSSTQPPLNECIGLHQASPEKIAQVTDPSTLGSRHPKVTICHRTSDPKQGSVTITIALSAHDPHMEEHDDYLGTCRAPSDPPCVPAQQITHHAGCGDHIRELE